MITDNGLPPSVVSASSSGGVPAWAPSTAYALNALVTNGGNDYICTVAHTSGSTFAGELSDWQQLGGGGGGGGGSGVPNGWIDVTASPYSADNTGTTDVVAAVNAAIQAVWRAGGTDSDGGGTVYFPPGIYKVDGAHGAISLNGVEGVRLQGAGPGMQRGTGSTVIQFTGTSGNLLTMHSTSSVTVVNNELTGIRFEYTSNAYTGDLLDFDGAGHGDVQDCRVTECSFNCIAAGITARSYIRLSQAVINYIDHCHFSGASNAIRLGDNGGTYVNVQHITHCTFNTNVNGHIYIGTADGENIVIANCSFEAYQAIFGDTGNSVYNMILADSWFGDGDPDGWVYGVAAAQGVSTIRGCIFTNGVRHLVLGGAWLVEGCYFESGTVYSATAAGGLARLVDIGNNYNVSNVFDSSAFLSAYGHEPEFYASVGRQFGSTSVQAWNGVRGKLGIKDGVSQLNVGTVDGDLILGATSTAPLPTGIDAAVIYALVGSSPELRLQPAITGGNGVVTIMGGATPTPIIQAGAVSGVPSMGFFDAAPVARPLLATNAGYTVDNVIAALQQLGLFGFATVRTYWWKLTEPSGTTATDSADSNTGTYTGGFTLGQTGIGDGGTAALFNGSTGLVETTSVAAPVTGFSVEAWFKTTTSNGGVLVGFSNAADTTGGSYDRFAWMDNAGLVHFGCLVAGSPRIASSTSAYNDGNWHQVVATIDPAAGIIIYVDGVQKGTNTNTGALAAYTGFWHVGASKIDTNWTPTPTSLFFNGTMAKVAIWTGVLTSAQVASNYSGLI